MRIVIVGGGPSGFSAAMVARQVGADVTLIERMIAGEEVDIKLPSNKL